MRQRPFTAGDCVGFSCAFLSALGLREYAHRRGVVDAVHAFPGMTVPLVTVTWDEGGTSDVLSPNLRHT